MAKKGSTAAGAAIVVVAILILAGTVAYLELTREEEKEEEILEEKVIDNQISPYRNQGLNVEVNRIRHRGLMNKMLQYSRSWRETPTFYWSTVVDGKVGDFAAQGVGPFNDWDTIFQDKRFHFDVEDGIETSDVTITIVEVVKSSLFGKNTKDIEREKIHVVYDYRTGRWHGDDSLKDSDGVGHYKGETFEFWFNIYQSDYDNDGIPYWTEVNVLGTDPRVDDSVLDPDEDGCPTSWEWRWDYDPHVWDDHEHLDPDIDGVENVEEYKIERWFADPYQPDIYIEYDGMEKGGLFDWEHVFYEEAQQMIIERFAQHGINVYIDNGWPDGPVNGGGEMLPYLGTRVDDIAGGALGFYRHNFADERKGIFRYLVVVNDAGWASAMDYSLYDTIAVDSTPALMIKRNLALFPRQYRVIMAKAVLHEMGHILGLTPPIFKGIDMMIKNVRWPDLSDEDHEKYKEQYHSIMNYNYIWRDRLLFDYSDGDDGPPYDFDDWGHFFLPAFQIDATFYEEPVDENFAEMEIIDKYPGLLLEGWEYDEDLTQQYEEDLTRTSRIFAFASENVRYGPDKIKYDIQVYVKTEKDSEDDRDIRVYAMPQVDPIQTVWTLISEGNLDPENNIQFYSMQNIIDDVMSRILQEA